MQKSIKLFGNLNILLGILLILLPIGYLVVTSSPSIWYRLNPGALEDEIAALTRPPFNPDTPVPAKPNTTLTDSPVISTEPQFDASLPVGRYIEIPSIKVSTPIFESTNEREALSKGVWHLPNFGSPDFDLDMPTVLAAHRWGSINLTQNFREQNLFYNLPLVNVGDLVIINWDQKQYKYKVTAKEESHYVSQLTDLILITCKFVNSPDRIVVYAQRTL